MIYPAQTSFIPVQIALTRFLEVQGWKALLSNYPYWYLDSTPFRYLTGPILPGLLVGLHNFLPISLFTLLLGLIGLIFPVGAVGVYLLVREMKGERKTAILAAVFYFIGPIVPLVFRFSDGLYLITISFLPYVLVLYLRLLKQWQKQTAIFFILSATGLILLDTSIIPTLIFGMVAVFLARSGWKRVEEKLKTSLLLIAYSVLLATPWYTPGYWLTLITAPSLAGKSLLSVAATLPRLLAVALAIFLGIFSTKFFKKRNLFRDFCLYWLFIFGFLSSMRFISDPDFWLDWIAYGIELQIGIAMGFSFVLSRVKTKPRQTYTTLILSTIFMISWLFLTKKGVIDTLQPEIEQTVEYRIGKELSEIVESGEKVFLSGSTAFWLNAFFDIPQVRGGVDEVVVHPSWDHAAWEIREGTKVELSEKWLKELGVKYLVVHDETSEEFYHDFTYPDKFEKGNFQKLYQQNDDRIYQLVDQSD